MASDFLVRRLLRQAGVSVLAGLLLSTAASAGGFTEPVGEPDPVSIDVDAGEPEVSIDPVDPIDGEADGSGAEPDDGGYVDGGEEDYSDGDEGDYVDEGSDGEAYWDGDESGDPVEDGTYEDGDGSVEEGFEDDPDGEVTDPECAECSGVPEISIDPIEMTGEPLEHVADVEVTYTAGPVRGTEPNQRGEVAGSAGDPEVGRDGGTYWTKRQLTN